MTKIYEWKENIVDVELDDVVKILKSDGLVIIPTETVYGIGASAFSDIACKNIFEAKGRAQDNPLIVHVSSKEMLYNIVEQPNEIEEKLIDAFMPGPFTIILSRKKCICNTATCFSDTVGIRMPSNKIINRIIEKSNIPLAAPSANLSTKPSGTCVEDIRDDFFGKVDAIIDGGKCDIGIESTVVKVVDGVPVILRPGFITEDDINNVVRKSKI